MIKNLKDITVEELYSAFVDSFWDYEINVEIGINSFREMLDTRSFNKDLSLGYFHNLRLVGFIFVGYSEINNKKILYDLGTGVVKEFRKTGIGSNLLEQIKLLMFEK